MFTLARHHGRCSDVGTCEEVTEVNNANVVAFLG